MSTVTCPYCWNPVRRSELVLRCSEQCPPADRVEFTARESSRGRCPHGRQPVARRFCPGCKRALLREYLASDGRNVAVIGSADAGKTTYIGVLLHELRGRLSAQFNGMSLDLLGDESRRNYEDRFSRRLYGEGVTVRQTPRLQGGNQIEPLIFMLKFPRTGSRWRRGGLRSLITVFYDASGENVVDAGAMDPLARYVAAAEGILMLIDPLQMPRVRQSVGGSQPAPQPAQPALPARPAQPARTTRGEPVLDQLYVVQRLAELLRERTRRAGGRLPTPLAIALTKLDVLRDTFNDHSPLRRTPRHEGYYDENDGRDVHEEIRGWLEQWYGPAFDSTVANNFATYRYFGLSALGAPPVDEQRLSPSGIHPYRVEDPMLWLLGRFGSIRVEGGGR